jgi:hypothetical protein
MTAQPNWELIKNLGDATPLEYGAYFVYRDTTGEYAEEAELLDVDNEEEQDARKMTYTVWRFPLDRYVYSHDHDAEGNTTMLPEWFDDKLGDIARTNGITEVDIREQLASDDALTRACAYRMIGEYHGFANLDAYPLQLTREEVEERYRKELGLQPAVDADLVRDVLEGYITCALWSSSRSHEDGRDLGSLDKDFSPEDIAEESRQAMEADVCSFLADNADDLADMEPSQIGPNFWLTRNGHGTGFWDRGLGERGTRLTSAAKAYGTANLNVGDDGRIYHA